jgi:hypothetical protein
MRIALAWKGLFAVLTGFIAPTSELSGTKAHLFGNQRVSYAVLICTP